MVIRCPSVRAVPSAISVTFQFASRSGPGYPCTKVLMTMPPGSGYAPWALYIVCHDRGESHQSAKLRQSGFEISSTSHSLSWVRSWVKLPPKNAPFDIRPSRTNSKPS